MSTYARLHIKRDRAESGRRESGWGQPIRHWRDFDQSIVWHANCRATVANQRYLWCVHGVAMGIITA